MTALLYDRPNAETSKWPTMDQQTLIDWAVLDTRFQTQNATADIALFKAEVEAAQDWGTVGAGVLDSPVGNSHRDCDGS